MDTSIINSSTIQSQPKMVVPPQTQDTTPYQSIIEGALTSLPSVQGQVDQATKTNDAILGRLASATGEIVNKEQYAQDQQNLAGVTDRQKELDALNAQFTDLGAQIKGLSRASQAVPLKVQENAVGQGVTTRIAQGQTEAELRKNAIQALTLASQADVLGAQITNAESREARAKENAKKAVDLKFKPIEAEISRLKDVLELNTKYILDPAEKKLAEKQTIALNERARLLEEKKQNDKDNAELMINANAQGAPAEVIANAKSMIDKGASPTEVSNALGVYSGDYIGRQVKLKQMKLADLEYKIKQNEFIQSTAPAIGVSGNGTIVTGSGANSTQRNNSTVEQLIQKNGKAIPDGLQTQIVTAQGVVNSIEELIKGNPTGEFAGMYPMAGVVDIITPKSLKKDETLRNEALIGGIELKVQQWASGASLTEEQTKLVQGMVPKKGDTDNVVKEKAKALTDMMNSQISASFLGAGIKYRPEKADYYDTTIASKVKNAVGAGYTPTQIVESYLQDPAMAEKIKQARQANFTDEQIVAKLQTLQ